MLKLVTLAMVMAGAAATSPTDEVPPELPDVTKPEFQPPIQAMVYHQSDAGNVKGKQHFKGTAEGLIKGVTYSVSVEVLENDLGHRSEMVTDMSIDGQDIGGCNPPSVGGARDYACTFYNCDTQVHRQKFVAKSSSAEIVMTYQGHSHDCSCNMDTWDCASEHDKTNNANNRKPMTAVGRFTFTTRHAVTDAKCKACIAAEQDLIDKLGAHDDATNALSTATEVRRMPPPPSPTCGDPRPLPTSPRPTPPLSEPQ